ncbi:unnamed protein product [Allacma fusca]|uniref:Uncharacterized protein n=1 Tax=Allacma fusca TaxID=39272 RepID=A0A8J2PSE7_9HEXA|nr:unnamed protein product [Allacma fusca]
MVDIKSRKDARVASSSAPAQESIPAPLTKFLESGDAVFHESEVSAHAGSSRRPSRLSSIPVFIPSEAKPIVQHTRTGDTS